jgi:hypothetical protein
VSGILVRSAGSMTSARAALQQAIPASSSATRSRDDSGVPICSDKQSSVAVLHTSLSLGRLAAARKIACDGRLDRRRIFWTSGPTVSRPEEGRRRRTAWDANATRRSRLPRRYGSLMPERRRSSFAARSESMDFMHDSLSDGRKIRLLPIRRHAHARVRCLGNRSWIQICGCHQRAMSRNG